MGLRESGCHNVSISSLMITPRQIRPVLSVSNAEFAAALCFQTIRYSVISSRVRQESPCPGFLILLTAKIMITRWPCQESTLTPRVAPDILRVSWVNISDYEQWGKGCDTTRDYKWPEADRWDREPLDIRGTIPHAASVLMINISLSNEKNKQSGEGRAC